MLNRLLEFVVGREPVATATGIAAVVTAALGTGAAFGLGITAEQIAAIGALTAALAGWLARSAVAPVRHAGPAPADRGSIPLALVIFVALIVIVIAGLATCGDALFEDEDEKGDLGIAAELSHAPPSVRAGAAPVAVSGPPSPRDHDEDWDGGGYREDSGGYGDRRGGDGRFGGGRSGDYDGGPGDDCRNACGNTIIVPSPGGGREGR